MPLTEATTSALERNWDMIDAALEGLDNATLARIPAEQCNSIAWLLWHLSRVMDTDINTRLQDLPDLWVKDGWAQKFEIDADAEDRGQGWTAEQVAAWKPPAKDVLLGYYQAVRRGARQYLPGLTQEDLDLKIVWGRVDEPRSVAGLLGHLTWDAVAHGGQIAYLRGLFKGMGWHI